MPATVSLALGARSFAQKPGFTALEDKGVTVVLDTKLTPELLDEGVVNEVISKLQNMRKDSGFEVMDRITVALDGNEKIAEIVKKNEDAISTKVLANAIEYGTSYDSSKEQNINGEKVQIGVKKV